MPTEASMYPRIEAYLKTLENCSWRKRHGCIYSSRNDSDFMVLWKSVHYEIEVKIPGKKATDGQWARLVKCVNSGGIGAVVQSVEQFKAVITVGQRGWHGKVMTFDDVVVEQPKRLPAGERKELLEKQNEMIEIRKSKLRDLIFD